MGGRHCETARERVRMKPAQRAEDRELRRPTGTVSLGPEMPSEIPSLHSQVWYRTQYQARD